MSVLTFDFDDTLLMTRWDADEGDAVEIGPNPLICGCLRWWVNQGNEVHIVTSRFKAHEGQGGRTAVADFVAEQRLTVAGIHFTDGALKTDTLARLGSKTHHDDDLAELAALPPGCKGVRVIVHPSWGSEPTSNE